jgi:hypothetical protein
LEREGDIPLPAQAALRLIVLFRSRHRNCNFQKTRCLTRGLTPAILVAGRAVSAAESSAIVQRHISSVSVIPVAQEEPSLHHPLFTSRTCASATFLSLTKMPHKVLHCCLLSSSTTPPPHLPSSLSHVCAQPDVLAITSIAPLACPPASRSRTLFVLS